MKNKFISVLASIGIIFGLVPIVAFADEQEIELEEPTIIEENNDSDDTFLEKEEQENNIEESNNPITEDEIDDLVEDTEEEKQDFIEAVLDNEPILSVNSPTGNWGQFGYSMNLSPDIANAWFEGTSNMDIDDYQEVGNETLQRTTNGSTGFWKYVIYNQWFKYPDLIPLDSITPVSANTAPNQDVDFIMWFQKNANDPYHFYNPGATVTYYGGYGTNVGPDYVAQSIYSVDAVWAIWTKSNQEYYYDGQPHTPMVQYQYNYTPGNPGNNAVDFFDVVKEQLDKTISVTVSGDANDYYEEKVSTIPDVISLSHGAQINAGNYNFLCAVDYYGASGTGIGDITNSPSTNAQLVINPRNVHFDYIVYEDYTGQPITATYTGNNGEYVNATNETGIITVDNAQENGNGLMEGDYVVFSTNITETNPGTYSADNGTINYKVYNTAGEDVTQNYNVTFDFKLVIEGEPTLTISKIVNVPAGWQAYYDSQNFVNNKFAFNVYIPADSNEPTTYTLKSGDIVNIPVEVGQTYKVEEVLTENNYQLVGTTLDEDTIQNGVNGTTGTINSFNTIVTITNAWVPNLTFNPIPMPDVPTIPEPGPTPEPSPEPEPDLTPNEPEQSDSPSNPNTWIPNKPNSSSQENISNNNNSSNKEYINTPWGKLPQTGDNILSFILLITISIAAIALIIIGHQKIRG